MSTLYRVVTSTAGKFVPKSMQPMWQHPAGNNQELRQSCHNYEESDNIVLCLFEYPKMDNKLIVAN